MSSVFVLTDEPYHDNSTVLGVFFSLVAAEAAAIGYLKGLYDQADASDSPYKPTRIEADCGVTRVDHAHKSLAHQKCQAASLQIRFPSEKSIYRPWEGPDVEQVAEHAGHVIYRLREAWEELK